MNAVDGSIQGLVVPLRVLRLTLKKKWFDMIAIGEKTEEYRTPGKWIFSRLIGKRYDVVEFANGYGNHVPKVVVQFCGWHQGPGRPEWGGRWQNRYVVIRLGRVISLHNVQVVAEQPELIVDNFAGGGGASTGIELALSRSPDIAINHNRAALSLHRANHSRTRHLCEDVWEVDPLDVTYGQPVGLCWFSPDCKHFSKAKGGKPVSKQIRGLAWVALRWAAKVQPRIIILENVEEFSSWGPLIDGKPCPLRKGDTFRSFVHQLENHGYEVESREMRACDYGAPTTRKRLFLIARRDGQPIVWPDPTHAAPDEADRLGLQPWRSAADCIDWSLPCPSIFERKRPLAEATCRRIARGIMRYVVSAAHPFIVNTANSKTTGRAPNHWSIGQPVRTITSSPGFALVAPVLTECANGSSPRCMPAHEPLRTVCAETKGGHHALVSAFLAKHYTGVVGHPPDVPLGSVTSIDHHSLVAAHLVRHFGASTGSDLQDPTATVMPGGQGKTGIVTSHLCKLRGQNTGQPTHEPLRTVSAQGLHHAEVRAFLVKYYGCEKNGHSLTEPMHTLRARHCFGLVTVAGHQYRIVDIGLRMLQPHELFAAQGFPSNYIHTVGVDDSGKQVPLTKTDQVRMCGNSVCPPLAAALVTANF